jgi:hypothetical protein
MDGSVSSPQACFGTADLIGWAVGGIRGSHLAPKVRKNRIKRFATPLAWLRCSTGLSRLHAQAMHNSGRRQIGAKHGRGVSKNRARGARGVPSSTKERCRAFKIELWRIKMTAQPKGTSLARDFARGSVHFFVGWEPFPGCLRMFHLDCLEEHHPLGLKGVFLSCPKSQPI